VREHRAGFGGWDRPCEQEALGDVRAGRAERAELAGCLDALGDGPHAQLIRQPDDGADDGPIQPSLF